MEQIQINGYKIQYKIKEGGISEIWYAQNSLQKTAAIKILKEDFLDNPRAVQIFENEAKVLSRLQHDFIRKVIDYSNIDHRPAIILEYLEGKTLAQYFAENKKFTQEQLISWWNEAVDVLQYIHRKNIIHNDISPSNLLITEDGKLHFIDFGLAVIDGQENLAADGINRLGSLRYLSPEAIRDPQHIKAGADDYSLAVVFYQLVSGNKPYAHIATSSELQSKIANELLPLHTLAAPWSFLLEGYLYKNAASRNALHKIDTNKTIDEDQTLTFTVQQPDIQKQTAINPYPPMVKRKKSGSRVLTFLVILLITALIVFAINEEKLMPRIQNWMGTRKNPAIETVLPAKKTVMMPKASKQVTNDLPSPQMQDTVNMTDEEDTNIKVIDIAQKEIDIKALIQEYYNNRTNCDKMNEYFAPLVKQYYTKSNLTVGDIEKECTQYHNKWKFVETGITPTSYVFKHQNNGKSFVDFNMLYKIKQNENDVWMPYNIDVSALIDNNNKIERIVEKRIEKL